MKVYELQFRDGDNFDESSFVLRVKTDGHLEAPGAVICKEIEIKPDTLGIDLIISSSFDPDELIEDHVRNALMINELTKDDIVAIHKALVKYMTSELTEDDVVTVRKTLIRSLIIELRKALVINNDSDIIKIIDKLYQILNEEIS